MLSYKVVFSDAHKEIVRAMNEYAFEIANGTLRPDDKLAR